MTLEQVAGRVEGVGERGIGRLLVALRQTRRPPAVGAEQSACAIEFGDDMPAVVEEVVARGGVGGLLPCPQPIGSIACGEGGAELYEAVFGVPGEGRIGSAPVVQSRVALPVVGGSDQLVVVVVGECVAAQCRQVVGSVGDMREVVGDEQVVVATAVCRAYAALACQPILIGCARIISIGDCAGEASCGAGRRDDSPHLLIVAQDIALRVVGESVFERDFCEVEEVGIGESREPPARIARIAGVDDAVALCGHPVVDEVAVGDRIAPRKGGVYQSTALVVAVGVGRSIGSYRDAHRGARPSVIIGVGENARGQTGISIGIGQHHVVVGVGISIAAVHQVRHPPVAIISVGGSESGKRTDAGIVAGFEPVIAGAEAGNIERKALRVAVGETREVVVVVEAGGFDRVEAVSRIVVGKGELAKFYSILLSRSEAL